MSQRDAFVAACGHFGLDEEARLRSEIGEREATIARLGGELRAVSRELLRSRRRLAGLAGVTRVDEAKFQRDYEALLALPEVAGIDVEGARVRIRTRPISIEHGQRRYRVGTFAIDLDLSLRDDIRVVNLEAPPGDGWDHPHIQAGLPCLGGLREGCEVLLGELDLVPLVSILLQFLESYDPPSAYASIERWAEVPA